MTLRNMTLISAAFATVCIAAFPAMADTQIRATLTAVHERIRPDPQRGVTLNYSMDVTLSGASDVNESSTRKSGGMSANYGGMKILGQKAGGDHSSWRVAGPNRLERVVNWPQNTTTMAIVVSGRTCRLDVQYTLKPGFNEYMFRQVRNNQIAYFTQPRVQSTTCTIR